MRVLKSACFATLYAVTCLWAISMDGDALASEDVEVLRVTGHGQSREQARFDAMRLALQQSVKQLIIADRIVESGELMRDRVMSTLNGHIASFVLIEVREDASSEFAVTADVGVSRSSIRNFMAYEQGEQSEVDGESLFAELDRLEKQSEAIDAMLTNALSAYPSDAFRVSLESIGPGKAGSVDLEIGLRSVNEFFGSFRELVKTLSERFIQMENRTDFFHQSYPRNMYEPLDATRICFTQGVISDRGTPVDASCGLLPEGDYFRGVFKGQFGVDVGSAHTVGGFSYSEYESHSDAQEAKSALPSHATYSNAEVVFALLDKSGHSVITTDDGCLSSYDPGQATVFNGIPDTFGGRFPFAFRTDSDGLYMYFGEVDSKFTVSIPRSSVDAAKAQRFVGTLVLAPHKYRDRPYVPFMTQPHKSFTEVCSTLLDNARMMHRGGNS